MKTEHNEESSSFGKLHLPHGDTKDLGQMYQAFLHLSEHKKAMAESINEIKEGIMSGIREFGPFLSVNKNGKNIVVYIGETTGVKVDKKRLSILAGEQITKLKPSTLVRYGERGILNHNVVRECEEETKNYRIKTRRATKKDIHELTGSDETQKEASMKEQKRRKRRRF